MAPISDERPGEAAAPSFELSVRVTDGCERAAFIPLYKVSLRDVFAALSPGRPLVADGLFSHSRPTFGRRAARSEAAEP
jgi:hypothetical protein